MNKRIKTIIEHIKPCECVCDVGSDHAQLAIYLLKHKIVKHCINTDIIQNPLNNTIQNLKHEGLINKTTNILADGLNFLWDKPIDYCVIAGLGGHTIANILSRMNKGLIIKNLILVCNTKPQHIINVLQTQKWNIINEHTIENKNRIYFMILANK